LKRDRGQQSFILLIAVWFIAADVTTESVVSSMTHSC